MAVITIGLERKMYAGNLPAMGMAPASLGPVVVIDNCLLEGGNVAYTVTLHDRSVEVIIF